MKKFAVIFDFDGLIIDTETPAYQAWGEIYGNFNQKLEISEWVKCVGSSYDHFDPVSNLEKLTNQNLAHLDLVGKKNQKKSSICSQLQPLPGVEDMIKQVKEMRQFHIALASSSDNNWVSGHLRRLNLIHEFDFICTKENVKKVKPNPELYLKVADFLNVVPKNCLVFEDSLNGVLAAKSAGMYCVAIPNPITQHLDLSKADLKLDSMKDKRLTEIMKKLRISDF